MRILTTTKNMMVKIEDQNNNTFSVSIHGANGMSIAASGFPTLETSLAFAKRFDEIYNQEN